MQELSLNVLDIAQNSVSANASLIEIGVFIDTSLKSLTISIKDNGKGMTSETMQNVTDPFYTTRKTRKVGLGIPFFKMAAEQTDGKFSLDSTLGVGTTVTASFTLGHVDLVPLGDMSGSICTLIQCNPGLDFVYIVKADDEQFTLDTRELRQILGTDVSFDNAEVALFIKDYLAENTNHIIQRSVT